MRPLTTADPVTLGLLLLVACVVAMAAQRIGLPYAIGLVAAGLGLAFAGIDTGLELTPDLIFTVLLPPLLFEAALHLNWAQFRRESPLVLTLAFGGTLLAATVVAAGMHFGIGWGVQAACLFGALIAATDPVSVIAMMKEQQAEPRLRFLMEAESLVNDGVAAVLFALVVAWIVGSAASPGGAGWQLATTVIGGVACGLLVAAALLLLAGGSRDPLVETTLTVLAAYGSFLVAEQFHVSGVLATVAAGMLVGNWGRARWLTGPGGDAINRFWDMAAFLANSVVFLLIGTREAHEPLATHLVPAAIATALVIAGRAVAIYPVSALFRRGPLALPPIVQHVLFWGGLRGALALALAMAAPAALPEQRELIAVTFAVVAFSIFVQGLTVPGLLRKAKVALVED